MSNEIRANSRITGNPEVIPGPTPKTSLRQDYVRFADDSYSIRSNHLKMLVFIVDLQG
jgi:hypothetical protein